MKIVEGFYVIWWLFEGGGGGRNERGEEEEERRIREEGRGNFGISQWSDERRGIFVHWPHILMTQPPVWPIKSVT